MTILFGENVSTFTTGTRIPVGLLPSCVATGDFNGDGKSDLVVASTGGGGINILLGDGMGGIAFTNTFPFNALPNAVPNLVTVGDLNGDLKSDIVITYKSGNAISVLLGNGVGGFSALTIPVPGTGPYTVAIGDVNGDNRPDLAVADQFNNLVTVLTNVSM